MRRWVVLLVLLVSLWVMILYGLLSVVRGAVPETPLIRFSSNREGDNAIYQLRWGNARLQRVGHPQENFPKRNFTRQWVVYSDVRDGNWEIYVMRRDGSQAQRLTYHGAVDRSPYWVPLESLHLQPYWGLVAVLAVIICLLSGLQHHFDKMSM